MEEKDKVVMRVIEFEMRTMKTIGHIPMVPTRFPARIYMMTPKIVRIVGV